jgi:hypothetical protein
MPAAIPFMVRISVSSNPGGYAVVVFNVTNSDETFPEFNSS